jgi:hypothetical protein
MELQKLSDFFKNDNYKFQKLDYLYLHYKSDYPLSNEMDFKNFFFIIEISVNKVKVMGLVTKEKKEFNFYDLKGNWWILRIPESIRKKLF